MNHFDIIKQYLGICFYLVYPKLFGRGYESYKNYLIKKKINKQKIHLNKYIDERVVEIPWVINELKKNRGVLLDAGSTLNKFFIIDEIQHFKKIFFTTLFPEKKYFNNLNISYTYEDLSELSFKDNFFDIITCISTLEHVGYDNSIYNYGKFTNKHNKVKSNKKLNQVLQNLQRVLKKNGKIFISLPFGQKSKFSNMQQFNSKDVKRILKILRPRKYNMKFFKFSNNKWKEDTEKNCSNILPVFRKKYKSKTAISSMSIVLIKATK